MPLILLGYHSTGGYKIFDLETCLVIISRDTVVDYAFMCSIEFEKCASDIKFCAMLSQLWEIKEVDSVITYVDDLFVTEGSKE